MKQIIYSAALFWIVFLSFSMTLSFAGDIKKLEDIESRLGPQDWNLTISQAIPFPGKLTQQGKVLEKDEKISKLRLDKTIKNIVKSISDSFYELIYIQNAIHIAKINFSLIRNY